MLFVKNVNPPCHFSKRAILPKVLAYFFFFFFPFCRSNIMSKANGKKARKANVNPTSEQKEKILFFISERKHLLFGKIAPVGRTRASYYQAWDEVLNFCRDEVGVKYDDQNHARASWKNWRQQYLKKKALSKKTGQGLDENTALTKVDLLVEDILTETETSKYSKVIAINLKNSEKNLRNPDLYL